MSWSLGRNPWATHLVECSGNHRNGHFGLISVAQWRGVPVSKVVAKLTIRPQATRVLISGLERYSQPRLDSLPQTSWIFSFEQLEATGAFFATGMNGSPLRKDHGYPIRLIVPGWYACTCIKWVDQIVLVDDTAAATHLMRDGQIRSSRPLWISCLAIGAVPAARISDPGWHIVRYLLSSRLAREAAERVTRTSVGRRERPPFHSAVSRRGAGAVDSRSAFVIPLQRTKSGGSSIPPALVGGERLWEGFRKPGLLVCRSC